jgi:hypothetical protein
MMQPTGEFAPIQTMNETASDDDEAAPRRRNRSGRSRQRAPGSACRGRPPSTPCPARDRSNVLRTLAARESIENRPLTRLTKKLIMIRAKVVGDGPYVASQMTEVAILGNPLAEIVRLIAEVRLPRFASGM